MVTLAMYHTNCKVLALEVHYFDTIFVQILLTFELLCRIVLRYRLQFVSRILGQNGQW